MNLGTKYHFMANFTVGHILKLGRHRDKMTTPGLSSFNKSCNSLMNSRDKKWLSTTAISSKS